MRKSLLVAFAAASCLAGAASAQATALPGNITVTSGIIQVSGGCGYYGHRNPWGRCVPSYVPPPYRACPPGYHLGPYGARCWPNF